MKALAIVGGAIVLIAAVFGFWAMGQYNGFVTGDQKVTAAWAQVETQYERRFALIPNLANTVKGILNQEQEVFGAIAEARTRYANAKQSGTQAEQVEAYGQYESVIGRLLTVIENYPELKSYAQVTALMDELAGTENRVLVVRDRYNEEVRVWNVSVMRFPTNLIARMFGFGPKEFFQATDGAQNAPTVDIMVK